MSIIHDALKKAQTETRKQDFLSAQPAGRVDIDLQKRKHSLNWGPIFVVLVLLLITGPIIAPVFSTPFKRTNPQIALATKSIAANPAQDERVELASLPATNTSTPTRQAQFGMEETMIPTPYMRPNFALSGIIYSPQDSYCLINDKVVRMGESIEGAKLTKVTPEEVTLEYHGEKIVLPVTTA